MNVVSLRLNVELEKTQDRLHKHKISSVEDIVGTVSEDSGVGGHTTSSRHSDHECKGNLIISSYCEIMNSDLKLVVGNVSNE